MTTEKKKQKLVPPTEALKALKNLFDAEALAALVKDGRSALELVKNKGDKTPIDPNDLLTYDENNQGQLFYTPKRMTKAEIKERRRKYQERQTRWERERADVGREQEERLQRLEREANRAAAIEAQRLRRPKRIYDDD